MPCTRIPDRCPVLSGEGLTLRELSAEDLPAWFERLSDSEAATLAGDPIATSFDAVVRGLEYHRGAFLSKEGIRWSIVPDELGVSVGTIGLSEFRESAGAASVGAAIGRAHWGHGIATRAGRVVLDYAFRSLALELVWAVVLPENRRIIKVLDRLGFTLGEPPDGIVREIGDRADTLYYAALRVPSAA